MKDSKIETRPHPRQKAWAFLRDCERSETYINIAMAKMLDSLDRRDRPFVTELVNGSVRMRRYLDFHIDSVIDRKIDEETRSILRLSIYEAYFMSTADHAIVNEYVSLAKKVVGQARAGFVNAVMRRVLRERQSVESQAVPLGVSTSHPDWIVEAYGHLLSGEELENELQSHNKPAATQVVSFESLNPALASKSPLTRFGYRLKVPPGDIAEIISGDAFVQDEGSQIVVDLALNSDPTRSLNWLDMCAGPGGKFRYLKKFLDPNHLVGNELHPHRAKLVKDQAPGYQVFVGDGRLLLNRGEQYDRILLDAPCTGIGALRRRPDARWRRTESDLKSLVTLQRSLLDSAAQLLRRHGIIAYITCSPHILETRVQVTDFLHRHKNFRLRAIEPALLPEPAREAVTIDGMVQLLTGRDGTDAMFLAMLEKVD